MKNVQLLFAFLLISGALWSQSRQLRGIVQDSATRSPVASATVTVPGKNISTVTGPDGGFTVNLPSGAAVIQVSSVGYATRTISVNPNQNDLIIVMGSSSTELGEVVVTALGISKESRRIGYAVTKIEGSQLSQAREPNVALALEGRVAGLNISGTNGGPGSSARILLRGMSSFTAGSPLFVINGVPMDNSQRGNAGEWGGSDQGDGISNINPDDIESMTVLKGASASALYGTRAANGVILITTKSARRGTFSVDFNSNTTIDKAIDFTDFQQVYGQGIYQKLPGQDLLQPRRPQSATEALNTTRFAWGERMDGQPTIQFDGNTYPYSPVKDNYNSFYRTGYTTTNTIAVGSGTDKGSFRLSLSYLDNQSIVKNSGLKRRTANLNVNQTIWEKITVSVMANYIDETSENRPYLSDGPLNPNNATFLAPNVDQRILAPGYDPNSPKGSEKRWTDDIFVTNPYFVVNRLVNDVDRKRLIAAITARWDFTDWLYLQGRLGYDYLSDRYNQVNPTGLAYSQNEMGSLGNLSTNNILELNPDVLAGIRRNITRDLGFDLTLGAALRKRNNENVGVSGGPFIIPFLYSPLNVLNFGRSYNLLRRESHSAYYSLDLNYKNFFTVNTTGRYDTYSTLPSNNRGIFTPSVSASFFFSELLNTSLISYGKLRASYSQTSGEPTQEYITQQYYSVGNSINGITTGSFSTDLPNLNLKPFTLDEFEIGAEMRFWKNRLGVDLAYFHRQTHNEIIQGSLSPATGYTRNYIGTGSTKNQGIELSLNGTPIQRRNFFWNSTFNFTRVQNEIMDIYGPGSTNTQLSFGTYRPLNANLALVKGLPGPQIMAYDWQYDSKGSLVLDATGVPLRADVRVPMGSTLPKYFGGWNNEFNYHGLTFSFLLDYKYGNKVLSATRYYALFRGLDKMTLEGRETGISVSGVTGTGTPLTKTIDAQTYYQRLASVSKYEVLNGDYIKLRQITLGYTFTENMLGRLPFQSIALSLISRNTAVLKKETPNIDPESGFSADVRYSGIEGTSLPTVRTFGVNLNVRFKNKRQP